MLMMVLWWEFVAGGQGNLLVAAQAPVDSWERRILTWVVDCIELCVIALSEEVAVFVFGHGNQLSGD
jgi:hypothetical protein